MEDQWWGGGHSSQLDSLGTLKSWEVKIVQKLLPQGDDPRERWIRQLLFKDQSGEVSSGHGCDGVDKGELLL